MPAHTGQKEEPGECQGHNPYWVSMEKAGRVGQRLRAGQWES